MSKHLVKVDNESIIHRTVRLIHELDSFREIIITSHDKKYELEGCKRYEPINNILEVDRFTDELITDNMCFLYGDTYYTKQAINKILNYDINETCFFGNQKSIVGVRVINGDEFKFHKDFVRKKFLA